MPDKLDQLAAEMKQQGGASQDQQAPAADWRIWSDNPPPSVPTDSTPIATIKNVGSHLKNMVMGPLHAFGDAPSDPTEQGVAAGGSLLSPLGSAGGQMALGLHRMLVKPTAQGIQTAVEQAGKGNFGLKNQPEYDEQGDYTPTMLSGMADAVPLAGPWARNIETEAHQKGVVPALAGLGTDILGAKALPEAPGAARSVVDYIRPRSSPGIVAPAEIAAERLGQAILPTEGLTPGLLRAIREEAPAIREFAQRTGNPLKTQPEGIKAAEGVAQEGYQHYRQNYLQPNARIQVQLPNNMSPELGHVATLEQLEKRISEINDLERAARGRSEGATMTALEKQGLQGEARALRQKLYDTLAERTGAAPEDIRNMREGYGGQYAIKDALESGRMARLQRTGRASQGQSTLTTAKNPLLDRTLMFLRGGEDAIANRQFASRIRDFEPIAPDRPLPTIGNPAPVMQGNPSTMPLAGAGTAAGTPLVHVGTGSLSPRLASILRPTGALITAGGNRINPVTGKKIPHI